MNPIHTYQHIAFLIAKERLSTLDESETKELKQWLSENPANRSLYEKLKKQNPIPAFQTYQQIQTTQGLQKYRKRYRSHSVRMPVRWISAAIGLLLIGVGIHLLVRTHPEHVQVVNIRPGTSKAVLIMADGQVKELEETKETETIELTGVTVRNSGDEIRYTPIPGDSLAESQLSREYNILKTPTGGEYKLILSDGTRVWLNSQSILRYPVNFTDKERLVYLEGEAYFDVTHDDKCPFIVHTRTEVNVQVLGTAFNVRAYPDEIQIETVLEQGSVKMWQHSSNVTLVPGTKGVFNKNNGEFSTEKVNTELYTAWYKGQYVFEEETIENILTRLSRWYDIHVFFADQKARNMVFSGSIRKYETIRQFLQAVEMTGGIRFQVKGNTIIVSSQPI